ncbi:hypothetical protein [Corynebacterium mastitidis]
MLISYFLWTKIVVIKKKFPIVTIFIRFIVRSFFIIFFLGLLGFFYYFLFDAGLLQIGGFTLFMTLCMSVVFLMHLAGYYPRIFGRMVSRVLSHSPGEEIFLRLYSPFYFSSFLILLQSTMLSDMLFFDIEIESSPWFYYAGYSIINAVSVTSVFYVCGTFFKGRPARLYLSRYSFSVDYFYRHDLIPGTGVLSESSEAGFVNILEIYGEWRVVKKTPFQEDRVEIKKTSVKLAPFVYGAVDVEEFKKILRSGTLLKKDS